MVIFGCGVVTGALLISTVVHSPAPPTDSGPRAGARNNPPSPLQIQRVEFFHRMEKQLNLTPEQHERIAKIMRASQDRTKPLWDIIAPQMRREVKRVQEEIRQELNPEQEKKFAELLKPRSHKPDAAPVEAGQSVADPSRTNSP
jgi:Spy/CpxP family protein refolding chaperone